MLTSIVGQDQLNKMVELAKTLPDGDFAEVGVYRGGSAWRLYEVCILQNRGLHLFDTFSGIPTYVPDLDHHKIGEFLAPGSEDAIRHTMPLANLYVGIYPDTHPFDLPPLAFIHCDCDQYDSYRAVIDCMWPLVVPGGIMLFDDYPYLGGAKKAVEESFAKQDLKRCHDRFYVVKRGEAE